MKGIQQRIANYVEKHGTKYTFATYLDSDTGRIVLDTNAPASVMAGLTSLSDPDRAARGRQGTGPPDDHQ